MVALRLVLPMVLAPDRPAILASRVGYPELNLFFVVSLAKISRVNVWGWMWESAKTGHLADVANSNTAFTWFYMVLPRKMVD